MSDRIRHDLQPKMCIRDSNVRLQRAQLDETINQFNTTVLTAVQEVDNAMSSYKNSIKQIVACRETVSYTHLDVYKRQLAYRNVFRMHLMSLYLFTFDGLESTCAYV